jgi:hypothetical protein
MATRRVRMTKTKAKLPKSQHIVRECKESAVKPPKFRKR